MRRLIDRFYVIDFRDHKRVFVATFHQQQVGDHTVEVYVRGTLRIWLDLPKALDKDGNEHDFSLLDLFSPQEK